MAETEAPQPAIGEVTSTSKVEGALMGAGSKGESAYQVPPGRPASELFSDQAALGAANGNEVGSAAGSASRGANALATNPNGSGSVDRNPGKMEAGVSIGDRAGMDDQSQVATSACSEGGREASGGPDSADGCCQSFSCALDVGHSHLRDDVGPVHQTTQEETSPEGNGSLEERAAGCSNDEDDTPDGNISESGANGFGKPAVMKGNLVTGPVESLQSDGPACKGAIVSKQQPGGWPREGWQGSSRTVAEEEEEAIAGTAPGHVDPPVAVMQWASPDEHSDADEMQGPDRVKDTLKANGFHGGGSDSMPCTDPTAADGHGTLQGEDLASISHRSHAGAVCKNIQSPPDRQTPGDKVDGDVPEQDDSHTGEEVSSGAAVDICVKEHSGRMESTGACEAPVSDDQAPHGPTEDDVEMPADATRPCAGDFGALEFVHAVTSTNATSDRPSALQGEGSGGASPTGSEFGEVDKGNVVGLSSTKDSAGEATHSGTGCAQQTGSMAEDGMEEIDPSNDNDRREAVPSSDAEISGPIKNGIERPIDVVVTGAGDSRSEGNCHAVAAAASHERAHAPQGEGPGATDEVGSDFGDFVEGSEDEFGDFGGFQDGTEDADDFGNFQEPCSPHEVEDDHEFGDFKEPTETPTIGMEHCPEAARGSTLDVARDLTALHGGEFLSEVSRLFQGLKGSSSNENSAHCEMDEGTQLLDALRLRHVGPPVGVVGAFGLLTLAQPPLGALRKAGPPVLLTAKVSRAEGRLFKHMGLPEPVHEANTGQVHIDVGELAAFTQTESKVVSTAGDGMEPVLDFDFLVQASGGSNISKSNLSIADSFQSEEPPSSSGTYETNGGTATTNPSLTQKHSTDSQTGPSFVSNAIHSHGSSAAGTTAVDDDPFGNIPSLVLPPTARADPGAMTDPFCQVPALELPNSARGEPSAVAPAFDDGTGFDMWYSETPAGAKPVQKTAGAGGDLLCFDDGGFESVMFGNSSTAPAEVGFEESRKPNADGQFSEASQRDTSSASAPNADKMVHGHGDDANGLLSLQGKAASESQAQAGAHYGLDGARVPACAGPLDKEQHTAEEIAWGEFESEAPHPASTPHPGDSSLEFPNSRGGGDLDSISSGPPSKGIGSGGPEEMPWPQRSALVGHKVVSSDTDLVWHEAPLDQGNDQQPAGSPVHQNTGQAGNNRLAAPQAKIPGTKVMDVWGATVHEASTVSLGPGVDDVQQVVAEGAVQVAAYASTDDWGDFQGNDNSELQVPFVPCTAAVGGQQLLQMVSTPVPLCSPAIGLSVPSPGLTGKAPQLALPQQMVPNAPHHGHGGSEPACGHGGAVDFEWGSFQGLPRVAPAAPNIQLPECMAGGASNASMRPPALASASVSGLSPTPPQPLAGVPLMGARGMIGQGGQPVTQGGGGPTKAVEPAAVEDDDWGEFQCEPTTDPFGFLNPIK